MGVFKDWVVWVMDETFLLKAFDWAEDQEEPSKLRLVIKQIEIVFGISYKSAYKTFWQIKRGKMQKYNLLIQPFSAGHIKLFVLYKTSL